MVRQYYVSLFREARSRSWDFSKSQGLATTIVLATLALGVALAFVYWRPPPSGEGSYMNAQLANAVIWVFAPTFILGIGVFFYHLVRAPAELAERARSEYSSLEKTLSAFNEDHANVVTKLNFVVGDLERRVNDRKPAFAIAIREWFQLMGPSIGQPCNLIFQVTVRNSGGRSALSDWKLEIPSLASEPISPHRGQWQEWVFGMVRDAKTGQRVLTDLVSQTEIGMDRGDIAQGTLMFAVPDLSQSLVGKETIKATLICLDAQGEQHCAQPTTSLSDITC